MDDKNKEAEINAEETKKQQEAHLAARTEDAKKCTAEFAELLQKYNCFSDVEVTINTNGRIKGQITIQPRL